jgi:hypothetical protein
MGYFTGIRAGSLPSKSFHNSAIAGSPKLSQIQDHLARFRAAMLGSTSIGATILASCASGGSVRTENTAKFIRMHGVAYCSLNYEAARIKVCRAVSRWRKACRCSRRETTSPMARRGWRALRHSSKAQQKRAAASTVPKPRMGSYRCLIPRWSCSSRWFSSFACWWSLQRHKDRSSANAPCSTLF